MVVVSGDRDLLQVVRDEPVADSGALPRTGPDQRDADGPHRGGRALRRSRRPGRRRLRRVGVAARRPVRRAARCTRYRREDRRDAAGAARLAGGASWPRSTTRNRHCPKAFGPSCGAAADYIEAAGPVVRVATDAPVTFSTATDALPLVAADPPRIAELATRLGVGSSIARLQKALDALPGS